MDTKKLNEIIKFATEVHRTQVRKGTSTPYITHPLAIALILARVTQDDDVIAGGILHDTIEDCKPYGSITGALLSKKFGKAVARMVNDVTEQDKSLSWPVRKQQALDHIKEMDQDSLLVKTADVLHNLTDLLSDIEEKGDKVFVKFNTGKDQTITRYQNLLIEITKAWSANPLLPELKCAVKNLVKISK